MRAGSAGALRARWCRSGRQCDGERGASVARADIDGAAMGGHATRRPRRRTPLRGPSARAAPASRPPATSGCSQADRRAARACAGRRARGAGVRRCDARAPVVRDELGGEEHRVERTAQIVPEDADEQIAPAFDLMRVMVHRFRNRLVDRLVEADHVVDGRVDMRCLVEPDTHHARPQGAVCGDQRRMLKPRDARSTACACAAVSLPEGRAKPCDLIRCASRVWLVRRSAATAWSIDAAWPAGAANRGRAPSASAWPRTRPTARGSSTRAAR